MLWGFSKRFFASSSGIKQVTVVGSGQMGTGIALVLSRVAQKNVKLIDVTEDRLKNSHSFCEKLLDKDVQRGSLSKEEMTEIMNRFSYSIKLEDAEGSQLMIEAANEDLALKKTLLEQLDKIMPKDAILASNTSSISITKLGSFTKRPEKVIGMHFFNPVPKMPLVEIVRGMATSNETYEIVAGLSADLKKETVSSKDMPGFIVNRVLVPYINEAFNALHEGISSKEEIDRAMVLGCNLPMGPLTLADFVGLDTCLNVLEVLYEGMGDPKFYPSPLLVMHFGASHSMVE